MCCPAKAGRRADLTQARRLPSRLPSNAPVGEIRRAFWLLRGGGQGRGRTADLPLFRRLA
jgi:hypothetical protein